MQVRMLRVLFVSSQLACLALSLSVIHQAELQWDWVLNQILGPKAKGSEILLCRMGAILPLEHRSPPTFGCITPAPCALGG